MADREDSDDKITVLFPGDDGKTPAGDDSGESQRSQVEDGGDEASEAEVEDQDGAVDEPVDESSGAEDKVVHLDFGRETTKRSPRPSAAKGAPEDPQDRVKYEVFSNMIDQGMVMVTLDTRRENVVVPPKFQGFSELRLNFSYEFHLDDFEFDARGVRASLSFQGTRHLCDIPWKAVFMLYSHATAKVAVFEPEEGQELQALTEHDDDDD